MPSGLQSDGRWLCKPCGDFFATCEDLLDHKQQMRRDGKPRHIHCKHCGCDFKTERAEIIHIHTFHPQHQKLICEGCGQGPFVRVAGLIAHIEDGQCTRLDSSVIDQRREKNMEFSRKLEILTKKPIKNNFAKYMHSEKVPSTLPVDSSARTTSSPSDAPYLEEDVLEPRSINVPNKIPGSEGVTDWFISLDSLKRASNVGAKAPGSSSVVNPMVRTERGRWSGSGSAAVLIKGEPPEWSAPSVLSSVADVDVGKLKARDGVAIKRDADLERDFGGGKKGQLPSKLLPLQHPPVARTGAPPKGSVSGSEIFHSMDPDHPDHPSFKLEIYYSPYADGYICPKMPCGKVFNQARGLISHLRSTAHGNKTYLCPFCLKTFKSLRAIVSHAESSSVRCRIRESDNYDAFIHQLTAGIVDVGKERHSDGTIKYETKNGW